MATPFHFFVSAAGLLLIAVTLPLTLELLSLSAAAGLPTQRDRRRRSGEALRLAVVIPAHNEEKLIGKCVASIFGEATVYVVAHNCTDATAQIAAAAGAKVLLLDDATGGKGLALNHGFRHAIDAGAQSLLVIDADSVAAPNLIATVSTAFACGAEALQCRYQVLNAGANYRTRLAALAFVGMNVVRPLGRHRLGLSCGIFGNGFGLSAATLARVPYTPNSLVEDLEYHLHLVRADIRVEFVNDTAVFGEMPSAGVAAASQRARWEGGRLLMRRQWSGDLAVEVMHGKPRLLEPLLDLLSVPLATEVALVTLAIALGVLAHLPWLTSYALLAVAGLLIYVGAAAAQGPEPIATLQALAFAPAYLAWKVLLIPKTRLAARRDAAWVRTQRNPESDIPPV